ncbi:MAG: ABC transporter permease subunit [Plesiomonas shigelloides]
MTQPTWVTPSFLHHTWLIARQEVIKGLFNRRGLIALLAYVLVWGLMLAYPIKEAASYLAEPSVRAGLATLLGGASPQYLLGWQVPELALFWVVSLYWFPLFAVISSADQFASERGRNGLRFLVQRSGREPLFCGRVLGQCLLQLTYIAVAAIATLLLISLREPLLLGASIADSFMLLVNLLIIIAPYIALMALLSLYAASARQAMLLGVFLWCAIKIMALLMSHYLPGLPSLDWLLPGSQINAIIDTTPSGAFYYAPLPLIQSVVLFTLGLTYFRRMAL